MGCTSSNNSITQSYEEFPVATGYAPVQTKAFEHGVSKVNPYKDSKTTGKKRTSEEYIEIEEASKKFISKI